MRSKYTDEELEEKIDTSGGFFSEYRELLPNLKSIQTKDLEKFKEVADAFFVVLEKPTLSSVFKFAKTLKENKDLIANVETAEHLTSKIDITAKILEVLSLSTLIIAILLVIFVIFSGFGKFNPLFLIITYIPAFTFTIIGGLALFALPSISAILDKFATAKEIAKFDKLVEILNGLSAGPAMQFMFGSGLLMLVICFFGVSKKSAGIAYLGYGIITLVVGYFSLSTFNVI